MLSLVMVLALLLVGCGSANTAEPTESEQHEETQITEEATEATEEAVEPVTEPETEPEETEAQRNWTLGEVDGYTYINHYAGYGCTLDENWTIYTAEELQDISDLVEEMLEGSDIESVVEEYQSITDISAECESVFCNFNVNYTGLKLTDRIRYGLMSEEDVVDEVLGQKDVIVQAYAQMGLEVQSMEKVTVNFLGEERYAVKTYGVLEGIDYYLLQIFDYDQGAYGITLTLSSFLADNTELMLDLFYAVD